MQLRISIRGCVRPSVRRSVCRSVHRSVPCYFRMTKNVLSDVPMMTKFDMDQETVKDNSKMTSKCRSVGLSVHWRQKRKKMINKWRRNSRILRTPWFLLKDMGLQWSNLKQHFYFVKHFSSFYSLCLNWEKANVILGRRVSGTLNYGEVGWWT